MGNLNWNLTGNGSFWSTAIFWILDLVITILLPSVSTDGLYYLPINHHYYCFLLFERQPFKYICATQEAETKSLSIAFRARPSPSCSSWNIHVQPYSSRAEVLPNIHLHPFTPSTVTSRLKKARIIIAEPFLRDPKTSPELPILKYQFLSNLTSRPPRLPSPPSLPCLANPMFSTLKPPSLDPLPQSQTHR